MGTKPAVLFVDDEPNILAAFERLFAQVYDVTIASHGEEALALVEQRPFEVVVSDLRMPVMDGAQLLSGVRARSPGTTRILLTGHADVAATVKAVNDCSIFRYLTKPCAPLELRQAVDAGVNKHRAEAAERELLQETLHATIDVLTQVLALASPDAFGRSIRVMHIVRHLVKSLKLKNAWPVEAAAMLGQLGWLTMPRELLRRWAARQTLDANEEKLRASVPRISRDILGSIPRMELVSRVMMASTLPFAEIQQEGEPVLTYASILRFAEALDEQLHTGASLPEATKLARNACPGVSEWISSASVGLVIPTQGRHAIAVPIGELRPGMVLDQDVKTSTGVLLVPKGHALTSVALRALKTGYDAGRVSSELRVFVD